MIKLMGLEGLAASAWVSWPMQDIAVPYESTSTRFETKFVSELTNIHEVSRWINTHASCFRNAFPERWVSNIYFDTYDYRSYGDNLAGISQRLKTRLRWYGKTMGRLRNATLEFKFRSNKTGWKSSHPITGLNLSTNWKEVQGQIGSQLPDNARAMFHSFPVAMIINRYRRQYYSSSDQKLRITVDQQMEVHDQRATRGPCLKSKTNLSDHLIVEFKFDSSEMKNVSKIINDFPLRPSRSSKYVTGVKAITQAV
jgi:hypothetical protein